MSYDINLGQIEDDPNYNFINKYDDENELFNHNFPSCDYYEMGAIKDKFILKVTRLIRFNVKTKFL